MAGSYSFVIAERTAVASVIVTGFFRELYSNIVDTETTEQKWTQISVEGFKAKLEKDTNYKGL